MAAEATISKVIERVQKLLNLAENASATPEEAANAADKARKLLLKHNLDMATVVGVGAKSDFIEENVVLGTSKGTADLAWKRMLLFGLARLNFCRALSYAGHPLMALVGKRENITATRYMYDYLASEIVRLARQSWDRECELNDGPPIVFSKYTKKYQPMHYKTWDKSFGLGAQEAIINRLRASMECDVADASSTALVLAMDDAVDEAVKQMFGETKPGKQDTLNGVNHGVVAAGYRAGQRINIDKELSSQDAKALGA